MIAANWHDKRTFFPRCHEADLADSIAMQANGTYMETISREECLRLIATVPVGRIVYTRQALPAVEVVNFAIDDDGAIVIKTAASGKLTAAVRGAIVAFEADSLDPEQRTGWSVTVIGRSQVADHPAEIERLSRIGIRSWAPGEREHFVVILPELVTGRMLRRPA